MEEESLQPVEIEEERKEDDEAAKVSICRTVTVLLLVATGNLFALSTWFSTNAIAAGLKEDKGVGTAELASLTVAVQAGFVVGTLSIATTGIADWMNSQVLFAICACLAGLWNLVLIWGESIWVLVVFRFLVGASLAGVYPISMRILSGWYQGGRGFALGLAVGALTAGSGLPHLLRSALSTQWEGVLIASSSLAVVGGLLVVVFVRNGPFNQNASRGDLSLEAWMRNLQVLWTNEALRFAYFGYLGHMVELYAFWSWVGVFLFEAFDHPSSQIDVVYAPIVAFAAFAIGAIMCPIAGLAADRIGRTVITSVAMVTSGICALWVGFVPYNASWAIVLGVLIWGGAIVPDSAQFSASMAELAPPTQRGMVLAAATGSGFLITVPFIYLVGALKDAVSWGLAFAILAIGPALGTVAMLKLRTLPDATKLASGNK